MSSSTNLNGSQHQNPNTESRLPVFPFFHHGTNARLSVPKVRVLQTSLIGDVDGVSLWPGAVSGIVKTATGVVLFHVTNITRFVIVQVLPAGVQSLFNLVLCE